MSTEALQQGVAATNGKPTNPKDAVGINKSPMFSYVPRPVMAELGIAMMEGGHKYGRHNYRLVGVRASIYVDATERHLSAWWEGEDLDPDSAARLNHIIKAIASLTVLRDSMIQGNWVDDRPPKSRVDWQALHRETAKLNTQYPNPKPSATELTVEQQARDYVAEPRAAQTPSYYPVASAS